MTATRNAIPAASVDGRAEQLIRRHGAAVALVKAQNLACDAPLNKFAFYKAVLAAVQAKVQAMIGAAEVK